MKTIINNSTDPHYNLALEEYVLKYLNADDDFILLWQNEPAIIIGRNQNTVEEVNSQYVKEHHIHVVRRISGGGAVYHDLGNVNFSFVTSNNKDNVHNFKKFTEPVIEVLRTLGVNAMFSGRNDITVDGKKVSGNAQSYYRNKMLHHGTILFNSNLDMVSKVLDVKQEKIESKGIKSVRSRVSNIFPYLQKEITVQQFINHLLTFILNTDDIKQSIYELTEEDKKQINKLVKVKYQTWEWNYGESPVYDIQKTKRFLGGKLDIRLNIENGYIRECRMFGDFFGTKEIQELEKSLLGVRFEEQDLKNIIKKQPIESYFLNITRDDVIKCLFE